ncbi:MAG: YdeI/OmpD-associated family protein [Saprospiraceae bacterium]|nr:YdeI/OmpD-associated family protein [Saprospiraceae bacterium]
MDRWQEEILLLREIILSTGLEETIKWGAPTYTHKGQNIVGLAAFKSYAGLWFFQGGLLDDKKGFLMNAQDGKTKAMRQWRFLSLGEIKKAPVKTYVLEAIRNSEAGLKIKAQPKKALPLPVELETALQKNKLALQHWQRLSPAHQREYNEYVGEAKKEETRQRRAEKCVAALLEKKGLNDQYKK